MRVAINELPLTASAAAAAVETDADDDELGAEEADAEHAVDAEADTGDDDEGAPESGDTEEEEEGDGGDEDVGADEDDDGEDAGDDGGAPATARASSSSSSGAPPELTAPLLVGILQSALRDRTFRGLARLMHAFRAACHVGAFGPQLLGALGLERKPQSLREAALSTTAATRLSRPDIPFKR